jgi:hypothetical protein
MTNGINYLIAQGRPAPQWDWMKSKQNALALSQAEREYAGYPEEQNWLREQRGMTREQFGWSRQQEIERIANKPFKSQDDTMAWFRGILDLVTPENWTELRDVTINRVKVGGGDTSAFDKMIPKSYPGLDWINNAKGKMAEKPTVVPPESTVLPPGWTPPENKPWTAPPRKEKPGEPKISVHYETDDQGNTVKVVTDATGETIRTENLGKIGKSREPRQGGEEAKVSKLNSVKRMLDEDYTSSFGIGIKDTPTSPPKRMTPEQRSAYQTILSMAEKYASKMEPRAAVNQALKDYWATKPKQPTTPGVSHEARDRAIQWLKANAPQYPLTEENINAVIQKQGFK